MRVENTAATIERTWVNQTKEAVLVESAKASASKAQGLIPMEKDAELEANKQEAVEESIGEMLKKAEQDLSFQLSFSIHQDSHRVIVKVVDPDTHKVLREIPPEEMLDFMVKLQDMLGILIDKRV